MRPIAELRDEGDLPLWRHPEWRERFDWVVQGTTGRGEGAEPLDMGLFGSTPVGVGVRRWRQLRESTGTTTAVHSRQVHGAEIHHWDGTIPAGLIVVDGYDGHLTSSRGVLLTISVADCVPIFLVDAVREIVGLAHAGWRGVAGGVLEEAVAQMERAYGSTPGDLWVHCGPSICGECYEVGPEVHRAIRPEAESPNEPRPIDLVDALTSRATGVGIRAERMTRSAHCTRCGTGEFFSYRAGADERQVGFIGLRS